MAWHGMIEVEDEAGRSGGHVHPARARPPRDSEQPRVCSRTSKIEGKVLQKGTTDFLVKRVHNKKKRPFVTAIHSDP